MKFSRQKFFTIFLSCVLMIMVFASFAEAKLFEIKVTNKTNKRVVLAFAREDGYNDRNHTTKGWWAVNPGEVKIIKPFNYSERDNYYWYAKSGNIVWRGDLFTGWTTHDAFTSVNGKKLPGGTRVGFRHLKESNGKASIVLTVKSK